MKKIFALSVLALVFVACNNSTPEQTNDTAEDPTTPQQETMVGSDRDEHGCIGSAGYSWSALRGECIQVFEVGTRLNPIDVKEEEAVISAFIVSKDGDNSQVELFITSEDQNPILKKEADGTFKNGKYTYNAQTNELSVDGKVTYKQ
ncbi:hypothetical protein [uncultured Capnocytophaga sp.]|uniref:hypothetical protein n=1 Tax=uncultured Capnocytophaga sp. TaxID=159273 RepID=UPI002621860D|nr:hypothetical protein [uncultured Capnocytophaga sp.]